MSHHSKHGKAPVGCSICHKNNIGSADHVTTTIKEIKPASIMDDGTNEALAIKPKVRIGRDGSLTKSAAAPGETPQASTDKIMEQVIKLQPQLGYFMQIKDALQNGTDPKATTNKIIAIRNDMVKAGLINPCNSMENDPLRLTTGLHDLLTPEGRKILINKTATGNLPLLEANLSHLLQHYPYLDENANAVETLRAVREAIGTSVAVKPAEVGGGVGANKAPAKAPSHTDVELVRAAKPCEEIEFHPHKHRSIGRWLKDAVRGRR